MTTPTTTSRDCAPAIPLTPPSFSSPPDAALSVDLPKDSLFASGPLDPALSLIGLEDEDHDGAVWEGDVEWNCKAPSSPTHRQGQGALHVAVCGGNEDMVRLLLDHGADIAKRDSRGNTALHVAAAMGSEIVVKLLLRKTADPDEANLMGQTPLFMAVQNDNEAVARILLLDAMADVNVQDCFGNAALHVAVQGGSVSMTSLLLKNGANINA
ncbi:ankyrin repeat domain-containing protein [Hirsutella rhossiliensis]|uniref:Ankyrin repeat domain-containing protein n=1 Tax=Hirsutella rhossiliensis TaxID=111463 RepID=A0A9P8SIA5_9HYPO|nr:ankyrin repeat domain-containing protein [Hirsutella rhossiliensis]KAH0961821.1 ankyrin repeat domain-containing protein [Hirsutella rhossiliensis]